MADLGLKKYLFLRTGLGGGRIHQILLGCLGMGGLSSGLSLNCLVSGKEKPPPGVEAQLAGRGLHGAAAEGSRVGQCPLGLRLFLLVRICLEPDRQRPPLSFHLPAVVLQVQTSLKGLPTRAAALGLGSPSSPARWQQKLWDSSLSDLQLYTQVNPSSRICRLSSGYHVGES